MSVTKIKDLSYDEYLSLLNSGMFWELYPEATGIYNKDIKLSEDNKFNIELNGDK